jgi:hypothetical protein
MAFAGNIRTGSDHRCPFLSLFDNAPPLFSAFLLFSCFTASAIATDKLDTPSFTQTRESPSNNAKNLLIRDQQAVT